MWTYDYAYIYPSMACATCAMAALLWMYSTATFDHWKKRGVYFDRPVPLVGNLASFIFLIHPIHEIYDKLYTKLGDLPYGGFFEMRTPQLLLKDPEVITRIIVTDFKYFTDHGFDFFYKDRNLNPFADNLFTMNGERWKKLRQKLSSSFTQAKIKGMRQPIQNCILALLSHLQPTSNVVSGNGDGGGSKDVNVKEPFDRLAIDVIGECAFGLECQSLQSKNQFREMGLKVLHPTFGTALRTVVGIFSFTLLKILRLPDMPVQITSFFQDVVYKSILHRRVNGVRRSDLLQTLMDLQNTWTDPKFACDQPHKSILSDDSFDEVDIAANAFTFFMAGYETSSSTMSFCLYELAVNPKIQDRLRAEVLEVRRKHDEKDSQECLSEMVYMDAVISETLRKYPPLPILFRQCNEDYVIPKTGLELKRGDKIIVPVWSIHRDENNFPNPDLFDPERFTGSAEKQTFLAGTYLPFGEGPRYCIGKRFALMEIKMALSEILMKYAIAPCSKTRIPLTFEHSFHLLSVEGGIWLKISNR